MFRLQCSSFNLVNTVNFSNDVLFIFKDGFLDRSNDKIDFEILPGIFLRDLLTHTTSLGVEHLQLCGHPLWRVLLPDDVPRPMRR